MTLSPTEIFKGKKIFFIGGTGFVGKVYATVRERFADDVSDLKLNRRKIQFTYPFGPTDLVEHFRKYFGPMVKAFGSLDADGQNALRKDFEQLWTR
ncbi:hypothetical protein BH20ACI2_BH20ACI2_21960 [soil metagenome]